MNVYVDISEYWLKNIDGSPKSVNSVHEEIKGTEYEVGRYTLRLALEGRLDRGHFKNLYVLAQLASKWAGKEVSVGDLLKFQED
ncbi:hypothetical protein [Aliterella atlantica]|uniref:hypothetical protein n=1 Tax=Aliterella atlantica TaxID=1827278 RepID=UPI001186346D|nr:hypothetical protein [Aliterella atlantica]